MLALTMGDPAGIGGELTVRVRGEPDCPPFLVVGDPDWLRGLGASVVEVAHAGEAHEAFRRGLPVLPLRLAVAPCPGRPDTANAPAVIGSIRQAVELAMAGEVGAVVTNPIGKAVLYEAGFAHPGHTEYLAALTGCDLAVMMLAAPMLRVVPVTIHVSLLQALATLSEEAIVRTGRVVAAALRRDFGIAAPRLAVAGLNPHAGENGTMGDEERTLIGPAIARLRAEGIDASGPWSADAMFHAAARAKYDVALCMYHDQALIPIKTLDRENGVNVTLGLPIVRTSPDHGTAFDIAGTGQADPASLRAAMRLAAMLVAHGEK